MTSITQLNKKYGNTNLYIGKLFSSSKDVLRFIQDYSFLQGKSVHVTKKSGRFRMYQCRDPSCSWKVNATITKDKDWRISYIHDEHLDTCTSQSHLKSRQIAEISGFRANVKADPETKMKSIVTSVQLSDSINLSSHSSTLYKVKDVLNDNTMQSYDKSFCYIKPFLEEYVIQNENSNVSLQLDTRGRFYRCYLSNDNIIKCLSACIDVYGMDAGHFKGRYNGVLLLLVGRDGDGANIILCVAIVPKESCEHYVWFILNCMKSGVKFHGKVVMVDRSKAILSAEHELMRIGILINLRFCTIHIVRNCRHQFKVPTNDNDLDNIIFKLQASKTVSDYESTLNDIEYRYGIEVRSYLESIKPEYWIVGANVEATARSFSNQNPRSLFKWRSTNFVESENKSLLASSLRKSNPFQAVTLGVQHFLEELTARHKKAREFASRQLNITPSASFFLRDQDSLKGSYKLLPHMLGSEIQSYYVYHPANPTIKHEVEVDLKTQCFVCDCVTNNQMRLPCKHIFSVMNNINIAMNIENSIHPCYKISTFNSCFQGRTVNVPNGKNIKPFPIISSPTYLQAGRPKALTGRFERRRYRSRGEKSSGKTRDWKTKCAIVDNLPLHKPDEYDNQNIWLKNELSKVSSKVGRKLYRCSMCNEVGHNKSSCRKYTSRDVESKENKILPGEYVLGSEPEIPFIHEDSTSYESTRLNLEVGRTEFNNLPDSCLLYLDEEEEKQIRLLMKKDESNSIIISKYGINITTKELNELSGSIWLGDEIINFWMNMLNDLVVSSSCKIVVCNTWYYTMISDGRRDYKHVMNWFKTQNVYVFAVEYLLIPVHTNGNHWMLALVIVKDKQILCFDSLGGDSSEVFDNIFHYLHNQYMINEDPFKTKAYPEWSFHEMVCPQQDNGNDCGVYLCIFAFLLTVNMQRFNDYSPFDAETNHFPFSFIHIPKLRILMASYILKGEIVL